MCRYRCVSVILLVLVSSVTQARYPVREPRLSLVYVVGVTLVQPRGGGVATAAAEAVCAVLRTEGFTVEVVDSLAVEPSAYFGLSPAPATSHLIVGFRSQDNQAVQTTVYTKGIPSARTLQAESPDALATKIKQYLGSEIMVLQRTRTVPAVDEFSMHMQNGLRLMLQDKNTNAAIAEFTEASRLRPGDATPHMNIALAYARPGNLEPRKKHIEEGLRVDPENVTLKNEQAVLFLDEGQYREAIRVLRELPPDDPVVQWNLSDAYWNLGEKNNAAEELKRIIKMGADPRLTDIAETRLLQLEKDASKLAIMPIGLLVSLIGLSCVAMIGAIILLAHFVTRRSAILRGLKAGDLLALRVQIAVTSISCIFGLLTVILPKIISK